MRQTAATRHGSVLWLLPNLGVALLCFLFGSISTFFLSLAIYLSLSLLLTLSLAFALSFLGSMLVFNSSLGLAVPTFHDKLGRKGLNLGIIDDRKTDMPFLIRGPETGLLLLHILHLAGIVVLLVETVGLARSDLDDLVLSFAIGPGDLEIMVDPDVLLRRVDHTGDARAHDLRNFFGPDQE